MRRYVPVLAGLAVVLAAAAASGLWGQRWLRSQRLTEAAARLEACPNDLGDWTSADADLGADTLARTGATAAWLRRYTNRHTGQALTVLLMCGPTGAMCKHRPEHCYAGAGFHIDEAAFRQEANLGGGRKAALWNARFSKFEPGGNQRVRIRWSWLAGDRWLAPESPRLAFLGEPFLYKLYVIRELPPGTEHPEDDPTPAFLDLLLPALERALAP
jgi:hypothetical protein